MMITTGALAETISAANGETRAQTLRRIAEVAERLGIEAVDGAWHDDDADEICLAIKP